MLLSGLTIAGFISTLIALVISITVHEFAHAWAANELGDRTAAYLGRLTLNPLAHLDAIGSLMILVAGFGWGRPVPVNPYHLRQGPKTGMALVSAAGPLSNIVMAALFAIPFRLGLLGWSSFRTSIIVPSPADILLTLVGLNVALAVFNLIPISPLDGFKVAVGFLPADLSRRLASIEQYGFVILMGLILIDNFAGIPILGWIMGPPTRLLLKLFLG